MNRRVLMAAFAFAFAACSLSAFENYNEAVRAAQKARNNRKFDESIKYYEQAASLAKTQGMKCNALHAVADIYFTKGDLNNSLKKLDEIVQDEKSTNDQRVSALAKQGNFCRWRGRRREAFPYFKRAMEIKTSKNQRHYLLNSYADLLIAEKKLNEAETLIKEALAIEKPSQGNLMNTKLAMGRLSSARENYDAALETYRGIIAAPKNPQWAKNSAYRESIQKVYIPQKKFQDANSLLDEIEKNPSIPEKDKTWLNELRAHVLLGQAQAAVAQKNYDEAARFYKASLSLPKLPAWQVNHLHRDLFFRLYYPQKKYDDALSMLEKAKKNPLVNQDWVQDQKINIVYFVPVRDLIRAKEFDQASKKLKSVPTEGLTKGSRQTLNNLIAEIEINRARFLTRQKKLDAALDAYKKVITFENTAVYLQRNANEECARVLIRQKKLDEAKAFIDTAFNLPHLDGNQQIANHHILSEYYLACQQPEDAIEVLLKSLKVKGRVDPNMAAASYERLAGIYFSWKKDLDKAEEYHKAALAIPSVTWARNKWLDAQIKKAREKQIQQQN